MHTKVNKNTQISAIDIDRKEVISALFERQELVLSIGHDYLREINIDRVRSMKYFVFIFCPNICSL